VHIPDTTKKRYNFCSAHYSFAIEDVVLGTPEHIHAVDDDVARFHSDKFINQKVGFFFRLLNFFLAWQHKNIVFFGLTN
jgi:hypothetical protein